MAHRNKRATFHHVPFVNSNTILITVFPESFQNVDILFVKNASIYLFKSKAIEKFSHVQNANLKQ